MYLSQNKIDLMKEVYRRKLIERYVRNEIMLSYWKDYTQGIKNLLDTLNKGEN